MSDYGKRADGTDKGRGYFGEIPSRDGSHIVTELGANETIDGEDVHFPLIHPGMSRADIEYLVNGGRPTDAHFDSAIEHAVQRRAAGKSPFAGDDDAVQKLPLLSYPERKPSESELAYFKSAPHVGGMMSEDPDDDQYVMNPYSALSDDQKNAVRLNEQARIYMRRHGSPGFQLTGPQEDYLNTTDYKGASPEARAATIAARLLTGDTSAQEPTEDQKAYVAKLRRLFLGEQ